MSGLRIVSVVVGVGMLAGGCAASVNDEPDGVGLPEPPFPVSSFFAPSGYMGDGASMTGTPVVADTTCATRPSGARGDCYKFTYTAGPQLWAGVYWQAPPNNWGNAEGKQLGPGADKVSFYAAGAVGGEVLKITIGGIKDPMLPFGDSIRAEKTISLTTAMTRYEVDLSGQAYDKVIGGFSWTTNYPEGTNPASAAPIVFYLDDLVWE